jgi:hypothetical protein
LVVNEWILVPINEEQFSEKEKKKNPSKRLLTKRNTSVSFVIFIVEQTALIPLKKLFIAEQNDASQKPAVSAEALLYNRIFLSLIFSDGKKRADVNW